MIVLSVVISVQEVERFRSNDPRAHTLPRTRQVTRDQAASTDERPVYLVAGQRVTLTAVPGGFVAEHADCQCCHETGTCYRVLAAVDAEGTYRYVQDCDRQYHQAKRAVAL